MIPKFTKKRNGSIEEFNISKIRRQIQFACEGTNINPIEVEALIKIPNKEYIETKEIQNLIILNTVSEISYEKFEMNLVAGRLAMYDLYRQVYKNTGIIPNNWKSLIKYLVKNKFYREDILKYLETIEKKYPEYIKYINQIIKFEDLSQNYDFKMVFAQVKMLESKYLIKNKDGVIEYPILSDIVNSLIITAKNPKNFKLIFKLLHQQYLSLATPFKANLRRPNGNVGSCFIGENIDSLAGLTKAFTDMSFISKEGGGIGWYLGKIRPEGTYTNNIPKSNKINKWIKIINDIAVAVNQRGIRKGAITVALDWWHMDIYDFLDIKSELNGDLREKAFDIFPQIVVDDFFINAVINNEEIYLFNQYDYKKLTAIDITELTDEKLLEAMKHAQVLAKEGKINSKKIKAKDLWKKILWIWIEIGDFYITHKDNLNKSNYLKNDPDGGIAKCGNLCVESFSISKAPRNWLEKGNESKRETLETDGLYHACNLLSINLARIAEDDPEIKNLELIEEISRAAVYILDRSIDEGTMPVKEAEINSSILRNIGIGFVGLGDVMALNHKLYDTPEGQKFGESIIERFSYFIHKASVKLAIEDGSYPAFRSENYNKLLGYYPDELNEFSKENGNNFDWVELVNTIKEKGIRNFYLLAIAPNTSTGILQYATASYLPVYNKEMYQTLANLSVPILPRFLDKAFWSYKTKFQYHPKAIIEFTRKIQRWIDTGISMEININPDICKINEISKAILDGFKSKELKAVYYSLTIGKDKKSGCTDCAN